MRGFRAVGELDRGLMRRSARLPPSRADDALVKLTRAANKSGLWWAAAALLALRQGQTRAGAGRGLAAIAGASALANLVGKPLLPRRRPAAEEVPVRRRLTRAPRSSSFPSGHAASAVAFATGVAMESPAAGAAVAPVAAAVAYSRMHTGVHWPSDIAAGALIGLGAAAATRHWWPLLAPPVAEPARTAQAPALDGGDGMLFLVNPRSGDDDVDPTEDVRQHWPKAAVLASEQDLDIGEQLRRELAARERTGERPQALGVAGGDGTVAAVAAVAATEGLPLAVVPAGTLNHFAKDLRIGAAARTEAATAAGSAVAVDVGELSVADNDGEDTCWFVNAASVGGYPEMVRLREKLEQRHLKWPAAAIATARTLRHARPLRVRINGELKSVWFVFVGNGSYAPKGTVPSGRDALDTGRFDVRYVLANPAYSRARFVTAVLTRSLHASHVYRQHDLAELDVELLGGHRRVALDGEVGTLGHRFRFRVLPRALVVYR